MNKEEIYFKYGNEEVNTIDVLKEIAKTGFNDYYYEKQCKAVEIGLNYIDKLQKENDNLNKKNKRYEKYLENKDIEHEKVLEYIETEKERDYISKDIIRNKIKELEEELVQNYGTLGESLTTSEIKVLKELLEE